VLDDVCQYRMHGAETCLPSPWLFLPCRAPASMSQTLAQAHEAACQQGLAGGLMLLFSLDGDRDNALKRVGEVQVADQLWKGTLAVDSTTCHRCNRNLWAYVYIKVGVTLGSGPGIGFGSDLVHTDPAVQPGTPLMWPTWHGLQCS
jgi:hypothetical protein